VAEAFGSLRIACHDGAPMIPRRVWMPPDANVKPDKFCTAGQKKWIGCDNQSVSSLLHDVRPGQDRIGSP
jgi:hypothetical protein